MSMGTFNYNWSVSLSDPYEIAVDRSGNVYVSNVGSSKICQSNLNNTNVITVIASSSTMTQSRHMYLDEENSELYVADYYNNRVQRFILP